MRSESIELSNGKNFRLSPDKLEFLANLKSVYPDQTVFSKDDLAKLEYCPYWVKSRKYPFTNENKTAFDLSPLLNVAILKSVTTHQIIFISLDSNVDSEKFSLKRSTYLFNH